MNTSDQHLSSQFTEDLKSLKQAAMSMGGMVEQQLGEGVDSLLQSDIALAKKAIANDSLVNQKHIEIDAKCAETLALRQPTASDLRLILTVSKWATDLERIGDLSKNLAKIGRKLNKKGQGSMIKVGLKHICQQTQSMLSASLNAFARGDTEAAFDIIKMDEKVNREFDALSRQLVTYMMEDPRTIKKSLRIFQAARHLERIGDHCQNLCEYNIYLIKGEDVRYQDIDDIRYAISTRDDEYSEEV